jgi:NDP-sugar pyrophosphorylase family protein
VSITIDEKQQGTVPALALLRKELQRNFILILGDTLNRFDLTKMIIYHLQHDRMATIGLISTPNPRPYSRVDMEGDRIIEFRNKESLSHVFDAGIYIFKPVIFKHLVGKRLDGDVFPKLCRTNDLKGYFTYGKYFNLGDQ